MAADYTVTVQCTERTKRLPEEQREYNVFVYKLVEGKRKTHFRTHTAMPRHEADEMAALFRRKYGLADEGRVRVQTFLSEEAFGEISKRAASRLLTTSAYVREVLERHVMSS